MIAGIGIDIVDVNRIGALLEKGDQFRAKVFSAWEIAYCEKNTNKFEHYAARFAAKEAFLKAAGVGLTKTYDLHEIEIQNDTAGKPVINLQGTMSDMAKKEGWSQLHVSISHITTTACAIVTIEK